jgi:uncharacterized protein YggT (Ycf19 family)
MILRTFVTLLVLVYFFMWTNLFTLITGYPQANWFYWMAYFGGAIQ